MRGLAAAAALVAGVAAAQTYDRVGDSPLYTEFFEEAFPFAEVTLDLRDIAPAGNRENLVPRAVMVRVGDDQYVAFDTELLRVAAVWTGNAISPESIAMLSYPLPLKKMGGGQSQLPRPRGEVRAHTGLYPGWQAAGALVLEDPRPRWVDPKELGRGPLPSEQGEWIGIEDAMGGPVLHYTAFGAQVREHFRSEVMEGEPAVVRTIEITGLKSPAQIVVGVSGTAAGKPVVRSVAAATEAQTICVAYVGGRVLVDPAGVAAHGFAGKPEVRWTETIATAIEPGAPQGAYAVDHLRLPYPNPWGRRIRPSDIQFLPDGDALVVTYDGDVYRLSGLGRDDEAVRWTRIAAGFNQPQSLVVRGDEVLVYSWLGLTRLEDRDGDGRTDFYRMFCNRFTQSADTRDFPMSAVGRADGSLVITKGGQQIDAKSPHSGRALWVSPDGSRTELWATGLRNAYVGIDAANDRVFASDQQGNWVPSTPFHVLRRGEYYGFEPGAPGGVNEITEPPLWLPHRIAQSGIDPQWLGDDPRLGPLRGTVLYVDYTRPGVTKIFAPAGKELKQTAGVPLGVAFEVPLLNASVNPADGRPYVVGLQVWGSFAKRLEGICRLRWLQSDDGHPVGAEVMQDGIWLKFAEPLDPVVARDAANFQVSSWNYRRAASYGSSYYKADGTPGVDPKPVHAVLVSEDRRSVFVVVPGLVPAMQIELQHRIAGEWRPVYFTAHELPAADLAARGFAGVNLTAVLAGPPAPRSKMNSATMVSEVRGQEVATMYGCIGCHSTDGSTLGKTGPTWRGLFGRRQEFEGGESVWVGNRYLREAILDPAKTIVKGYGGKDAGMPPYRGVLSDTDVESLILYIRSLK